MNNADSSSWACKNSKGVQVLFWDFTRTLPDSVNNQAYYIKDLPAKEKGKAKLEISNLPPGNYALELHKIGYKVNDAYATYLSLGKPNQLTNQQVDLIKKQNNGAPISKENVTVGASKMFLKELQVRENDVFFLNLFKQ